MWVGKICVRSVQVAEPSERVRTIARRMAETGTGGARSELNSRARLGLRIHEEDRWR